MLARDGGPEARSHHDDAMTPALSGQQDEPQATARYVILLRVIFILIVYFYIFGKLSFNLTIAFLHSEVSLGT